MTDSDVVIRVEGLGKKYALHHETSEGYTALRDVVARQAKAAWRLLNPFTLAGQLRKAQRQAAQDRAESEEEFWALKDVSFEIRRGERVGIIGRNGAGKSTLLKILSRITEPTTGRVEIRGRVASLLEVGTGFHPELTGRENVYLNGAILGMTQREIRLKFDEIVDFAEVEKFLDTPVKRYSSGMYVRLAFAVAAYLEPEILVVDEVLAVGDASFQKKCLGKMKHVSEGDRRTVLFVSHQMNAISALCSRAICLESGGIKIDSNIPQDAISYYEGKSSTANHVWKKGVYPDCKPNPYFNPTKIFLAANNSTHAQAVFSRSDDIYVVLEFNTIEKEDLLTIGYDLYSSSNTLIYRSYQTDPDPEHWPIIMPGSNTLRSRLPSFLNEGEYSLILRGGIHCRTWLFAPSEDCPTVTFSLKGGFTSPYCLTGKDGLIAPIINWRLTRNEEQEQDYKHI